SGNILFSAGVGNDSNEDMRLTQGGFLGIGTGSTLNTTSRLTVAWASGDSSPTATIGTNAALPNSSDNQIAIQGVSYGNIGVEGLSTNSMGVYGYSNNYAGVFGQSQSSNSGVFQSNSSTNTAATLVTQQQSTATADLFQAQSASGASGVLFNITSNGHVGIGTVATSSSAPSLIVNGGIQQTGFNTSSTTSTPNQWVELGTCTIDAQYHWCNTTINIIGNTGGVDVSSQMQATLSVRVRQQQALGATGNGGPYVNIALDNTAETIFSPSDFKAVVTTYTGSKTVVGIYGELTETFEQWNYTPVMNTGINTDATEAGPGFVWTPNSGLLGSLPSNAAGAQVPTTVYGDSYANTMTVASLNGNTTSAFQVQNASNSSMFNIDTTGSSIMVGGSNTSSAVSTSAGWEWDSSSLNNATLSTVSTHNAGDLIMVAVNIANTTGFTVTGVSGGGVTSGSWHNVTNQPFTSGPNYNSIWQGTVSTTGSSPITITYSGSGTTGETNEIVAQEFSAGLGSGTKWVVTSSGVDGAASTSMAYPSLTSAQAAQLYWGYNFCTGTSSSGSTPGFTYQPTGAGNQIVWDQSLAADTIYGPTSTCSSSGYAGAGAIVSAYTADTSLNVTGSTQISSNSTSAFNVQSTGGTSLFNVDATNNTVTMLQNAQVSTSSAGACGTNSNLEVTDSFTVPTNAVRWRTNACGANLESSGVDMYISGWTDASFGGAGGTQQYFLRGYLGSAANSYADSGLFVGNAAASATPMLLILANKNTSGDPAFEFNGGMYFDSTTASFRCGENGYWAGCTGLVMAATANSSKISTGTGSIFSKNWTEPQNDCEPGVVYQIDASGYLEAATAAVTYTFYLYQGGVQRGVSSGLTMPTNNPNTWFWEAHLTITCRTTTSVVISGYATQGGTWAYISGAAGNNVTESWANNATNTMGLGAGFSSNPAGTGAGIVLMQESITRQAP
ncbi:MAG: beta strand repeat-containing protein, partial [Candidatus Saccharimonadales bacterium]